MPPTRSKGPPPPIPSHLSVESIRQAAQECRACDLWRDATQAVTGEGTAKAQIMLVGEVPGDKEDLAGKPFVGPAGKLLDRALAAAGIDRGDVYITNAVKHFRWEPRGRIRIHKKPSAGQIAACRPWLEAEIRLINPRLIVLLGATAAQSLLGASFRVTHHRGEMIESRYAPLVTATVHPSSILRAPDDETRAEEMRRFVDDLRTAAFHLRR
jgi:uracil-DNA glycosylase family protein